MTPQVLLEHFDRMGEAPDAISRLRRFILDLAVRGKLVDQDPRDEPASVLLKQIQAEKARLVKEGQIRKQQFLLQIEPEEVPFEIPAMWEWTRLGEIGLTQTGTTPSKNHGDHFGEHIPFIKPGNLYPNNVDYANEGLSETGLKESGRMAPRGSLLMVCIGTIGKCQLIDRDCSFNQQLNSLSPYGGLCSKYLLSACLSEYFQKSAWAASARTTIAILNKGKWELLLLPLPPRAEQHRIVAKVDELMALCDRLEAAQTEREGRRDRLVASSLHHLNNGADSEAFREHARFYFNHLPRLTTSPDHIKQLRQTILNIVFQGRIVPQSHDEESGADLLKQIKSYHPKDPCLEGRRKKNQPLLNPLDCPGIFTVPVNWAWTYLVFLCETIADVDHKMPKAVSDGVPFISAKDLKDDGTIDFTAPKMISEDDFKRLSRKVQMRRDDIVYSRIGARLGKARLVNVDTRFLISYSCCLVRPLHKFIDKHYLQLFLDSTLALRQAKKGTQSIGVPDLGLGEIKAFKIPVPPLAEQDRIVAKVDELMALCDQLETQLTTTQSESRHLLEAVLHEALAKGTEKY